MKRALLVVLVIVLVGLAFAAGRHSLTKNSCSRFQEKTGEKKADKAIDPLPTKADAAKAPVFPSVRRLPNCTGTEPGMVADSDIGFSRGKFVADVPPNHKLRAVWKVYVHGKFDEDHSLGVYHHNYQLAGPSKSFLTLGIYDPDILRREKSEWIRILGTGRRHWIKEPLKNDIHVGCFGSEQKRKLHIGRDVVLGEIRIGRDYSGSGKPDAMQITLEIRLELMTKADEAKLSKRGRDNPHVFIEYFKKITD